MSASLILIHLIGAVCLMLWGARMVRTGFTRAYGTDLRRVIILGTDNRIKAFFSGVLVTGFLQSSTATTLIVSSFIKKSFLGTAAALAIVIGADVSTTLVAQVLTLDLSWLSPVLLAAGIITHMIYEHGGKARHVARAIIGLGLILLALTLIRDVSEPLKSSEVLPLILQPLENDTMLAIVFAALFTWLVHSSLASVLLFAAMASNHLFSLDLALIFILGANLGGSFIPFAATFKDGPEVRRVTVGNIFMRFTILILCLPFIPLLAYNLEHFIPDIERQIVTFHTGFNIALAIIFLPLVGVLARGGAKFFPPAPANKGDITPLYLDDNALDTPVVAMAGAARETLRMAEIVEEMLEKTIKAFAKNDPKIVKEIREIDNKVDRLYYAIKIYLIRLSQESLDPKEADRYVQILTFATNLEHCGDIIDKNLMELASKKIRKQENFSEKGWTEIKDFHHKVVENLRLAQTVFLSCDSELALQLIAEKKTVRQAESDSSQQHFNRLREGHIQTLATSSLHLDMIRDLRRINSYVSSVAYTVLETLEAEERKAHLAVKDMTDELKNKPEDEA